jgi:hypothetical protein
MLRVQVLRIKKLFKNANVYGAWLYKCQWCDIDAVAMEYHDGRG